MVLPRNIILVFLTVLVILASGFYTVRSTASISVIGGSDGPTAIFVTTSAGETAAETDGEPADGAMPAVTAAP